MAIVQPAAELLTLTRKRGLPVVEAIRLLFVAVALDKGIVAIEKARENLGRRIAELMGLANMLARRRVEIAVSRSALRASAQLGAEDAGLIPKIKWFDAIDQIADRYPQTVPAEVRQLGSVEVQKWVGQLYEAQGFTLAKTAQTVVVERVRQVIEAAEIRGTPAKQALQQIIQVGAEHGDDFSRGYAQTVLNTNLNTAYSAGIHEQAARPSSKAVIGALQYVAAMDSDTTDICKAAHGTLAPADDPIWEERSPPLHYNCRSGIHLVAWTELDRMGAVDRETGVFKRIIPNYPPSEKQKPQPGFGGRRT